jgi:hypothetical protein
MRGQQAGVKLLMVHSFTRQLDNGGFTMAKTRMKLLTTLLAISILSSVAFSASDGAYSYSYVVK